MPKLWTAPIWKRTGNKICNNLQIIWWFKHRRQRTSQRYRQMMSNTATFTLHILNMVKRAIDKIWWVLRAFQSRKHSLILTLLKFLVIPLLECCWQLWNPWKVKHIQAIEAIQRTFFNKVTEVQQKKEKKKYLFK